MVPLARLAGHAQEPYGTEHIPPQARTGLRLVWQRRARDPNGTDHAPPHVHHTSKELHVYRVTSPPPNGDGRHPSARAVYLRIVVCRGICSYLKAFHFT